MTAATRAMLVQWLASGTEIQQRHAAWRLSLPDEPEPEPQPLIPLAQVIAGLALVHRCPYRNATGCGCSGARCGLAGRIVSHRDCLDCVRRFGDS